ncbi:MAG: hypothetical protein GIW99_07645 [Candidatus Eremiobacteraeota bacterium]|nr:hypothetical protein [Candidatus Eremiobacteraeota bacterium]MBC5827535.1 hypothetical protein [Candidatus Eremiobacteraeota bacterium]
MGDSSEAGIAVGIDAGASKTLGLLVDRSGAVVDRAVSGGANIRSVGLASAERNLSEVLGRLLSGGHVRALCVGAAGIDRPSDRDSFERLLATSIPAHVTVALRHDAQIALRAATAVRPAVIVVAGTGSLVWGERRDGTGIRAGGYGALIGDDGSAYTMGLAAVHHAARVLDGAESAGALSAAVIESLGTRTVNDIIAKVHRWPPDVARIASLAALVHDAYVTRDVTATHIVDGQGHLLADCLEAAVRSIQGVAQTPLPIVLSGGAFTAVPELANVLTARAERIGGCEVCHLRDEPVVGAVLCALELAAGED